MASRSTTYPTYLGNTYKRIDLVTTHTEEVYVGKCIIPYHVALLENDTVLKN